MGCSSSNTDDFVWKSRKNGKISTGMSQIKFNISSLVQGRTDSIADHYKLIKKIGSGTFGIVYKVKHILTNQFRAMKIVKKDIVNYQDDNHEFLKEIEIQSMLDHPNIIKIFEYFIDEINFYVISELAKGGELYEQIYSIKNYNEINTALIMQQLLSAVSYIHSKNIVHRDLKPENILLETKGEPFVKIIDFGSANFCKKGEKLKLKVGTPYYIAPEVIKKDYNSKCDIWSLGIIMYMLLSGSPPFDGSDDIEIMDKIIKGEYSLKTKEWDNVSDDAKDLVKKLLTYNPSRRITAEDAKNHPWIIKNRSKDNLNNSLSLENLKRPFENLKKFSAKQKFQQTTIAFLIRQLANNDTIQELRQIFRSLDDNNDGILSFEELKKGFIKYYGEIGEKEWEEIKAKIDQDGSNSIEYEEFIRCTINLEDILTEQNLRMAFDNYDTDNSGFLDIKELRSALGILDKDNVSADLLKDLLLEIDKNGDGEISYTEFKELMMKVISTT